MYASPSFILPSIFFLSILGFYVLHYTALLFYLYTIEILQYIRNLHVMSIFSYITSMLV